MSAGQPLTHCPVCRYDLTGLPKNHRCPECGFEYEETMRIWIGARRPTWFLIAALLNGLASVFFTVMLLWGGTLYGSTMFVSVMRYMFFANALVDTFRYFRAKGLTLLSSRGITYKRPFRAIQEVPWSKIRFSDTFRCPMRRSGDDWVFFWDPISHLPKADHESLLATIRDRSKGYDSSSGTPIEPVLNAKGECAK